MRRTPAETTTAHMDFTVEKRRESDKIIALCGNPNVGKSTVFNSLTGLKQHTGNWAGKTVSSAQGYCEFNGGGYVIVDLPGCYSLSSHSAEEEAAHDFICSGGTDAIIVVCDATCMERGINLALQTMELSLNVVVCVNLLDEAEKKHISVNLEALSQKLGVPVVGTAARKKNGLAGLMEAVETVIKNPRTETPCIQYPEYTNNISEQRKKDDMTAAFLHYAEEICENTVIYGAVQRYDSKLDRVLTGRLTAFPIMILALLGVLWLTISGANYPSSVLSTLLLGLEKPLFAFALGIGLPQVVCEMIILGVYRVVAWVVSVMLPPMAIFFPLFTLLEDIGILPRIAFNLDKCFQKCRACGKQALTMCMGFGCNAAGVVGCRIINSPRERLIAIITNSFVPCNGRFPTLIAVSSMFLTVKSATANGTAFLSAAALTLIILTGVTATFITSRLLSGTLLKGLSSSFAMELPPFRPPQVGKVIIRSVLDRTLFVLGRAVCAAAPAGLIIWVMANVSISGVTILTYCENFLNPFAKVLGMDGVILLAFILGFPANEIVIPIMIMAYMAEGSIMDLNSLAALKQLLADNGWTWVTAVNVILFSLMHWPCSTTCLTIKKETRSLKWTIAAILIPTAAGAASCFLFTLLTRIIV